MLLKRLILENFKCYTKQEFAFERGITSISGENGAGKSTILEAISWILFNSLNYKSTQRILKMGAKAGRVKLLIESSRDRQIYLLERSFPTGLTAVKSETTGSTICEGVTELLLWVKNQLGLHKEDNLEALCRNGIAPPQGSLTRDFLESAARRKLIFDNLLGLDNYKLLDEKLKETYSYLNDRIRELGHRMEGCTQIKEEYETVKSELADCERKIAQEEGDRSSLDSRLIQKRKTYEDERIRQASHKLADQKIQDYTQRLTEISADLAKLALTQDFYAQSLSEASLYEKLRLDRKAKLLANQERQVLIANQQEIQKLIERYQVEHQNVCVQLTDLGASERRLQEIKPLLEEYQTITQRLDRLFREKVQLDGLIFGKEDLKQRLEDLNQEIKGLVEIELEWPIRQAKASQYKAIQESYLAKQTEYKEVSQLKTELDKLQAELPTEIRVSGQEEGVETLNEIDLKIIQTGESIEEYTASVNALKAQLKVNQDLLPKLAESGFCPLLQQNCLNLDHKPRDKSIESWLDAQIESLQSQAQEFSELARIALAEHQALLKWQSNLLRSLEIYATIGDRTLEGIKNIGIQLKAALEEAQSAQSFCERHTKVAEEIRDRQGRQESMTSKWEEILGAESRLEVLSAEWEGLEASKIQLKQVADEGLILTDKLNQLDYFNQLRLQTEQRLQEANTQNQSLEVKLTQYNQIPSELEFLEGELDRLEPIYQAHLVAKSELDRQAIQQSRADELEREREVQIEIMRQIELKPLPAADWFATMMDEIERDQKVLNEKEGQISGLRLIIQDRVNRLSGLERKQAEFKSLEEVASALTDKLNRLSSIRTHFRHLAAKMAERLTMTIGEKATQIMQEIMQDGAYQLKWTEDYEILTYRHGQELSFEMLSGGQQSAAAIAIRLGILEGLSHIRFAFLDEPTAHLDQERRQQLSLQLGAVKSFDQLFVITHDESFASQVQNRIELPL